MIPTTTQLAGRELDVLVAEHVMGFRRMPVGSDFDGRYGGTEVLVPPSIANPDPHLPNRGRVDLGYFVPKYSAEFGMAMIVAAAIQPTYWIRLLMGRELRDTFAPVFECYIGTYGSSDHFVVARGETAALAICRAAVAIGGTR